MLNSEFLSSLLSSQFFTSLFVVWRESVEALLVVGILYAWIKREKIQNAVWQLWLGVFLGLVLAALLGVVLNVANEWYNGPQGAWLQGGMMIIASLLILQMIIWMHRHGAGMKKTLEKEVTESFARAGGIGILFITMLAVAREGAETVLILSGAGAQQTAETFWLFVFGSFTGFILAIATFLLIQLSSHVIKWKYFFAISAFILLLFGGGLLITGIGTITQILWDYDLPSWFAAFIGNEMWDSSWLLKDRSWLTQLTGYHATPFPIELVALIIYWGTALFFCLKKNKPAKINKDKLA